MFVSEFLVYHSRRPWVVNLVTYYVQFGLETVYFTVSVFITHL